MVRNPSYRHRHSMNCRPGLAHATQKARKDKAKRGPFVERAFRRFSTTSGVVIWEPVLGGKTREKIHKNQLLLHKEASSVIIN